MTGQGLDFANWLTIVFLIMMLRGCLRYAIIQSESEVTIMNSTFVLQSTIEIILTVGFIWGLFNEHKLARIEKKLFSKIKSIRAK